MQKFRIVAYVHKFYWHFQAHLKKLFGFYLYVYFVLKVPGPPEQIKALAMTSDSIMVAWTRPLEPNGNIIKYNVYYHSLLHKVSFRMKIPNKQFGYLHEADNCSASQNFFWILLHLKVCYHVQ